jgi:pimeloyl-ACP methyl ester carboxylesterase
MIARVILLHGLWMPAAAMRWFAARLVESGYAPDIFGYHSILGEFEATSARLADRLAAAPCHVVAHSLGGLVALETLAGRPDLPVARVVCLGTPLCGSGAAESLRRWPLAPLWTGRSGGLLQRGCTRWPATLEVGMVAGRVPRGLGALFAGFEGEHDGTVAVAETRLPALADHAVVDASHSGLLFSRAAARLAAAFLAHGRFEVAAPV